VALVGTGATANARKPKAMCYERIARKANSGALLVPRGCGFADPMAYGIDESGTEGRIVSGA
jgi:hypothetical protein